MWIEYEVTPATESLLGYIRDGAQYIDILTVHNGQPTLAETDMKLHRLSVQEKSEVPDHTHGGLNRNVQPFFVNFFP